MPAYELSFAGIELTLPAGEVLIDRAAFGEVADVLRPFWTGFSREWQTPELGPIRECELNRLYWPRSASRFAVGRFLANEDQLDRIRHLAYTGDSRGNIAMPFVASDRNGTITTDLYMIGATRPLYQWDTNPATSELSDRNIYVITLVDERYWWWFKSANIAVTSQQSWETLYSSIASALGIAITVDTIPEAYMSPSQDLASKYHYIPPLLDAVAYSCGQRIIRNLDGTVSAQNASAARTANLALFEAFAANYLGGGDFRFDGTSTHTDLPALVPSKVRLVFPIHLTTETRDPQKPCADKCTDDVYTVDVDLHDDLELSLYADLQVKSGVKTFQSTAIAWYSNSPRVLRNGSELSALTTQLATDWYTWQAIGDQSRLIPSLVAWTGEAANDFVEWQFWPKPSTLVVREAVNDLSLWVFQESTRPTPDHSSGPPGSSGAPYTATDIGWKTSCEGGFNHRYYQLKLFDFTTFTLTTGPWIFESVQGCCNCWPFTSSSGPDGSSGPPNNNECISGTTGGIPWLIQRTLTMQFLEDGGLIEQRELVWSDAGNWPNTAFEVTFPCVGEEPDLRILSFAAAILGDGSGIRMSVSVSGINGAGGAGYTFIADIPMPPFGAGFAEEGVVINLPIDAPLGTYFFCGTDLAIPSSFSMRLIGASCAMPPPEQCIPGNNGGVPWLMPVEMRMQLWQVINGVDPPRLFLETVIRNEDRTDLWQVIAAETHPCDGIQPALDLDATARINGGGTAINLEMVIRDTGVEIVDFTADVAMPTTYGGGLYNNGDTTPLTLAEDTICECNAADEWFLVLIANPCDVPPTGVMPEACAGLDLELVPVSFVLRTSTSSTVPDPLGTVVGTCDSVLVFDGIDQWNLPDTCFTCDGIAPTHGVTSFAIKCAATVTTYRMSGAVQGTGSPSFDPIDHEYANGYLTANFYLGTTICGEAIVWLEATVG